VLFYFFNTKDAVSKFVILIPYIIPAFVLFGFVKNIFF